MLASSRSGSRESCVLCSHARAARAAAVFYCTASSVAAHAWHCLAHHHGYDTALSHCTAVSAWLALSAWSGSAAQREITHLISSKAHCPDATCADEAASGLLAPNWCMHPLPLIYSHVQDAYWNVGLFRYYKLKQLPNFALAAPVVLLLWRGLSSWSQEYGRNPKAVALSSTHLMEYGVPVLLTVVIVLTTAHVQIMTRVVCSMSPLLYWLAAPMLGSKAHPSACVIIGFCAVYCIVGTVLFANFYPWT
eukprot:m.23995 g.23995  ORF g.23995 m.23995 type:complete len:249 (-) comp4202_c0_seq1:51-797(-)